MSALGSAVAQAALARQGSANKKDWSLDRDNQLRAVLGSGFEGLVGNGILAGGRLVDNGGVSVYLPAGDILFSGGVALVLDANAVYNGCGSTATNTVWAKILRTAASQAAVANLDTYSLSITHTTDTSSPGAGYFCLGTVTTVASDITALADAPAASFVALSAPLRRHGLLSKSVAGSADVTATPNEALKPAHKLTGAITGDLSWILPLWAGEEWMVWNATTGAHTLTVKGASGTGIVVLTGERLRLVTDGTNFYRAADVAAHASTHLSNGADPIAAATTSVRGTVLKAAASANAAGAQSGSYVQADVQAILDELRDLKSKLVTAGLLS